MVRRLVLATTVLAWAAVASAQTAATPPAAQSSGIPLSHMTIGYTYFNRPGADLKTHNSELESCANEASKVLAEDETIRTGQANGLLGAMIGGAIIQAYHHGAVGAALENCMVVKGWRVVLLPDAEGKPLAALAQTDLAVKLTPWISATVPHGEIVRVWGNDATNAENKRYSLRPEHTNDGQLSLIAATGANLTQFGPISPPGRPAWIEPRWPKRALKVADLATAPTDSALIMIQIKDLSMHGGIGIVFSREGADKDASPANIDHAPDVIAAFKGLLFAHRDGDMIVAAIPAGRWRINSLGLLPSLSFCLGSPAFDVKAGEVIYAGAFDLSGPELGPNLDLAPARAWLEGQPQAQTVKAAVYTNGSRGLCGTNAIYALEIKGAPYEPGYVWGGALPAATPTSTTISPAPTPLKIPPNPITAPSIPSATLAPGAPKT